MVKLVKRKSKHVRLDKDGKEKPFYNIYVVFDNGVEVCVKPQFENNKRDSTLLFALAEYERK